MPSTPGSLPQVITLQAGTVMHGMHERSRPYAPRAMRRLRLGSSLRQVSKTSSGAAQSRPMTNSLGGREATRLLDGSLLDQRNGDGEDGLVAGRGGERAAVGRAAEGVEIRALDDQPHAVPTGDVWRRERLP